MKEVIIIILDKFADWEVSFVSLVLNSKEFTLNYSIKYASVDKKIKTSIGNLKVLPDITIDDIDDNASGILLIGAKDSWNNLDNEANNKIINIVKKFKENKKVVGSICDASRYLAINGLLNDCKHTVNDLNEIKNNKNYKNHENCIKTDINSIIDKKIVTSTGTGEIHFAMNIMKALGDIPEEKIRLFYDIYTKGFEKAYKKYNERNEKKWNIK